MSIKNHIPSTDFSQRHFSRSVRPNAKSLVFAEHDNKKLAGSTLNTITAALQLGGPVDVLVAGHDCSAVAKSVSELKGVNSVTLVECSDLVHPTAERLTEV